MLSKEQEKYTDLLDAKGNTFLCVAHVSNTIL